MQFDASVLEDLVTLRPILDVNVFFAARQLRFMGFGEWFHAKNHDTTHPHKQMNTHQEKVFGIHKTTMVRMVMMLSSHQYHPHNHWAS